MKKLLIIIISLPLIFSSCEKEENNAGSSSSSNNIIGTWEIQSSSSTETTGINGNDTIIVLESNTLTNTISGNIFYVFKNNGLCELYNYMPDTTAFFEMGYEKNADQLILEDLSTGEEFSWTITALTDNNLVLSGLGYYNQWEEEEEYYDSTTEEWIDTTITYFTSETIIQEFDKSQLPNATTALTVLSKEKYPAGDYKSFLEGRENR